MSKKVTRPLFIPKQDGEDFPFEVKDLVPGQIKQIDFFRMYNAMKMTIEKIIPDQNTQVNLQSNIDTLFHVFIEKEKVQKSGGKRNSLQTQKPEFQQLLQQLNQFGYSQKYLNDKLQLGNLKIKVNNDNNKEDNSEAESHQGKKNAKEKNKQDKLIERQQPFINQEFSTNEQNRKYSK